MKIFAACLLLASIGLTLAAAVSKESYPGSYVLQKYLQHYATSENDQSMEENEDVDGEDTATLQGLFTVLAQVKEEKASTMSDENAISQIWGLIGKGLVKYGKKYLKRKYCSEEEQMTVMLQDLVGEQGDTAKEEVEEKAMAELQSMFNNMKKVEAEVMVKGQSAQAQGWLKKLKKWAKKKVKRVTRKYLC